MAGWVRRCCFVPSPKPDTSNHGTANRLRPGLSRPPAPAVPAWQPPRLGAPVASRWKRTQQAQQPRAGSCVSDSQESPADPAYREGSRRQRRGSRENASLSQPPASQGSFLTVVLMSVK